MILGMDLLLWGLVSSSVAFYVNGNELFIGINDFKPKKPEVRICTSVKLNNDSTYHLSRFKPVVGENIHHMVLAGCENPGSDEEYWNCGQIANLEPNLKTSNYCSGGSAIWIYEWSFRASMVGLSIPEGFGFQVGKDTDYKYLVLEVHFGKPALPGNEEESNGGVYLSYDKKALEDTYLGMLNMRRDEGRVLPAKQITRVEMIGILSTPLQPLKFLVHTHGLGIKVSGYLIKANTLDSDAPIWIKIGVQSPPLPQDFLSVANDVITEPGDLIAVRCTYYNPKDEDMKLGPEDTDEMCEFGILYATKRTPMLQVEPATIVKDWDKMGLKNIPEDA